MTRKKLKLEEAQEVKVKENVYFLEFNYGGADIQSVIDSMTQIRDEAISKGAIPETIFIEMETHYGYYDDRYDEWFVSYTRMETEKETEKRVKKTLKQRETARKNRAKAKLEKEEADRKEYERLKEKYGG
jgi:hypothetical protein